MKNKKGFTLVELLVVITLIGLLTVIAIPSGLAISKKIKKNMMDSKIEIIESGAIVWGQQNKNKLNTECPIDGTNYKCVEKTIGTLLNEENALEADEIKEEDQGDGTKKEVKHLKNPTTDKSINECVVSIYIKNKRIYAKYNTDPKETCYYLND